MGVEDNQYTVARTNMSDDIFDKLFARLEQQKQAQNTSITKGDGFQDVNMGRVATHHYMQQQRGPAPTVCTLKPGAIFYRPLNVQGWPAKYPICREGGIVPNNAQQFEYKGEIKAYKVDQNAVDFSKMDESSPNLMTLIEVKSNFVGSILVPASAIAEISKGGQVINAGKQILKG
jgi:hypothetical protein